MGQILRTNSMQSIGNDQNMRIQLYTWPNRKLPSQALFAPLYNVKLKGVVDDVFFALQMCVDERRLLCQCTASLKKLWGCPSSIYGTTPTGSPL